MDSHFAFTVITLRHFRLYKVIADSLNRTLKGNKLSHVLNDDGACMHRGTQPTGDEPTPPRSDRPDWLAAHMSLCDTKTSAISPFHLPSAPLRPRSTDRSPPSWRRSDYSQRPYQYHTCSGMSRKIIRGNKSLKICFRDPNVGAKFPRYTVTGTWPFRSCTGWTQV